MLLVPPFWTSEVLRMFALVLLLAEPGRLERALRWLGLTNAPVSMLYGNGTVLAGLVYTVLLTMLLPLYAALDRLPADHCWTLRPSRCGGMAPVLAGDAALDGARHGRRLRAYLPGMPGHFRRARAAGWPITPVFATTIADLFGAASGRWPSAGFRVHPVDGRDRLRRRYCRTPRPRPVAARSSPRGS